MSKFSKVLRLVIVAAMLVCAASFSALAAEITVEGTVSIVDGQPVLTTADGKAYILDGGDYEKGDEATVTGELSTADGKNVIAVKANPAMPSY